MGDWRRRHRDGTAPDEPPREGQDSGPAGPGDARDEGAGEPAGAPRRPARRGSFLRELPVILVAALVLSLLIKSFLVQAFYIPSGSMEETLAVGDRVFVNKLATRFGEVERGDIVVFRDPADWLPDVQEPEGAGRLGDALRDGLEFVGLAPSASGDDLIKRVIGVGGDTVACCDAEGRVTVNGVPLDEEGYLFPGNEPSASPFEVEVPEGYLWVMGDHREESLDSRAHTGEPGGGFLPEDDVVGRAFVVVWPFDRFKGLTRPDTFDQAGLSGD
ncbi:signal peptidase I [Vallicoccus soli]|uniref:Signal peptidase I n=1 Tax=Vallicoccus soli TaxID=2339232 RepID=A0A3A3Z1Y2_9ACTN|nr:signal peptidase I [Vallicoccus soli]RJK98260.1 signal peptidase I [Vallicoccus soli]